MPAGSASAGGRARLGDEEAGGVEAGGEEEGVAEGEQAGVAEGEVVAHGEDREHHDPGEVGRVVGRQHEGRERERGEDGEVQAPRPSCGAPPSRRAPSEEALRAEDEDEGDEEGREDLGSVGEKKTETMPSERPMRRAATTVPRKRAEAADDDDDEGEEQRVAAHQVVGLAGSARSSTAASAARPAPRPKTRA